MRTKYLIFFCLPFLFVQCMTSRYDVFQLDSTDTWQNDEAMFFSERPFLKIQYDYWQYGGSVWTKITNTSEDDVWLFIEESGIYVNDDYQPHLFPHEISYARRHVDFFPRPMVHLPPQQSYSLETYPIQTKKWKFTKNADLMLYNENNSPLKLKMKWVIADDKQMLNKRILHDHFWLSRVEKMKPRDFKEQEKALAFDNHFFFFKDYRPFWREFAVEMLGLALSAAFLL